MFALDNDERLVRKALGGSQRAWTRLVARYESKVYNQALRMTRNRADAMDLMQETFLAVYRNLPNYRGDGSFPAWVARIAINRALDFQRHRSRLPEHSSVDIDELLGIDNPQTNAGLSQRNGDILRLLDRLSLEQRAVVELKFFQQCTFEDIAQQLGISSNTAKTRLYAALEHMQKHTEVCHAL